MLDIDLLNSRRPQMRSLTIYTYREGYFRQKILSKLISVSSNKGMDFREVEYDSLLSSIQESSILGDSLVLIDLNKIPPNPEILERTLDLLEDSDQPNSYVLTYKCKDSGPTVEKLKKFKKNSTYIEEVSLEKNNFNSVFEYLVVLFESFKINDIENLPLMKTLFKDLYLSKEMTLPKFFLKVEECLIMGIRGNSLDSTYFRGNILKEPNRFSYILHDLIFDLIQNKNQRSKELLFREIERGFQGGNLSGRVVINKLFYIVSDFITVSGEFEKTSPEEMTKYKWVKLQRYKTLELPSILKFQFALISHESELLGKDFLFSFNHLLNIFCKRT